MIKIFSCIVLCLNLSGCIFLYREGYTINRMAYWENKTTGEIIINQGHKECVTYAKSSLSGDFIEKYAICVYGKGFIFKTSNWLYCYHHEDECKIYDRYRK